MTVKNKEKFTAAFVANEGLSTAFLNEEEKLSAVVLVEGAQGPAVYE